MSYSLKVPSYILPLSLVVLVVVCVAAIVAVRNYRAAHSLLEADSASVLLGAPERTGIAGLRSVAFKSRDQLELQAWYCPPGNGAVVIVTHGTNSDRSSMLPELRVLTGAGFGVLAFDWPGLGHSAGTIRWDGQARRALAGAIDWLSTQPDVDPTRIGGLGFSIGAFVMAQVAAEDLRLRTVVLEAPAPNFDDYVRLHYRHWGVLSEWPARWGMRESGLFDSAVEPVKIVSRIAPRPVLIVGGSLDQEISPTLVTKVYDAAREPKSLWIVRGAQHGGYYDVATAEYTRRLTEFFTLGLQKNVASAPPGA